MITQRKKYVIDGIKSCGQVQMFRRNYKDCLFNNIHKDYIYSTYTTTIFH